jgi:hypothetical protein
MDDARFTLIRPAYSHVAHDEVAAVAFGEPLVEYLTAGAWLLRGVGAAVPSKPAVTHRKQTAPAFSVVNDPISLIACPVAFPPSPFFAGLPLCAAPVFTPADFAIGFRAEAHPANAAADGSSPAFQCTISAAPILSVSLQDVEVQAPTADGCDVSMLFQVEVGGWTLFPPEATSVDPDYGPMLSLESAVIAGYDHRLPHLGLPTGQWPFRVSTSVPMALITPQAPNAPAALSAESPLKLVDRMRIHFDTPTSIINLPLAA